MPAEGLKERIQKFITHQGITMQSFERKVGLSNGSVSKMGDNTRRSTLDKISNHYPSLNMSWLLTGEGEMLKSDSEDASHDMTQPDDRVPLIPASAFAGGVRGFAPDSALLKNCEKVVSPVMGAEYAIPITGDSMEPDYPDGAIAYIRSINEEAFIPWGHTVILDTENGAFIKKIYPDEQNQQYVWAKSINPAYPPLHIPKSSIFRMFRVLGTSRIFTTM